MKDLTPEHMKCGIGVSCPQVFELENGDLAIVGKAPSPEVLAQVADRIGPDEAGIVVPPELFDKLKGE